MMRNNEQLDSHSSTITNVLTTPTIVVSPKVNIGPVTTFRMMKEIVGGYDNIGASKQDFKNFHRDLKAYIQGSDAQMFVDNFTNKKLMWSAFLFDFEMDEDYCLCRALWADPLCKKSYALFGDIVSFDTIYQTNRYNMVFTPFTGVDRHKSCITFAAGFIAKEDIVSFKWLFRSFLKKENGLEVAKVSEGNRIRTFDVVFNPTNYDTTCSCKLFYRQGIPCRHMIWVWKAKRFETIPEQYMKKLLNDLWSEIHTCVSLVEGKDEDIQELMINIQGIRKDLEAKRIARNNETTARSENNKGQDIELLIGASVPTKIIVKPPKFSKNKGTGVHLSNEETSKKKGAEIDVPNVETRDRSAKG
ncbi:protein FAR1-RELATED SEQUENCE 5-like [Chenopodium quinoa]|uniref:protein FAR1-RELATED SEQUENCE 5-like n=1 Tax=Chenopodium quinoa TaxID=63459 RepID=UPI000B78FA44|nr:protein FAR1-RELATED SEQUENCE 5-like [Chenopodium quinoa]